MRRNILYEVVSFLGEARTIRGRSQRVRRIRGLFNESENKSAVIGDFILSKGRLKKAKRKEELRK